MQLNLAINAGSPINLLENYQNVKLILNHEQKNGRG